jgi:prevent-host-death family protein
MAMVNIHEAKTHFSQLVQRAAAGEEILIGKAGVPVAKLVPFKERRGPRKPGALKGQIWIAPDFDELPEEVASAFRGEKP